MLAKTTRPPPKEGFVVNVVESSDVAQLTQRTQS